MTSGGFNFTRKNLYSTEQQVSTIDIKDYHSNITRLLTYSEKRQPGVKWDTQPPVILYHNADAALGQIMQNGQSKNTAYLMIKIGKVANKKQQRFKEKMYTVCFKFATDGGIVADLKVPIAEAFDVSDMNMIIMLGSRAMAHDALEKAARKMMTTTIDLGLETLHGVNMNRLCGMLKGNRASHILVIRSLPVGYQMIFTAAALEATPEQLTAARAKLFARKRNQAKDKDSDVTVSTEEMTNERKNDSEAKARQAATLLSCLESSDAESGLSAVVKIIRFQTNLANCGLTDELDIPEDIDPESKFGKKIGKVLCGIVNDEKDPKKKEEFKTKAVYKMVHKCHKAASNKQFPPDLCMEDFHSANAGGVIKETIGVLLHQALPLLNPHTDTLTLQFVHRQIQSEIMEAKNDDDRKVLVDELSVLKAWPENGEAEKVITSVYKRATAGTSEDAEKLVKAVWLNMHAVMGDPKRIRRFLGADDTEAADMFLPANLVKWARRLQGGEKPGPISLQTFPQTRDMKKSRETLPLYSGGFGTGLMPTYVGQGLRALKTNILEGIVGETTYEGYVESTLALDFQKDEVKDIVGGMASVTKESVSAIIGAYSEAQKVKAVQSLLIPAGSSKVIELGYDQTPADQGLAAENLDELQAAYDDLITDSIVVNAKNLSRLYKGEGTEEVWAELLTVFYNSARLMARDSDSTPGDEEKEEVATSQIDTEEFREQLTALRKSNRACGMMSGSVTREHGISVTAGAVARGTMYVDFNKVDVVDQAKADEETEVAARMELLVSYNRYAKSANKRMQAFSQQEVGEYMQWIKGGRKRDQGPAWAFAGKTPNAKKRKTGPKRRDHSKKPESGAAGERMEDDADASSGSDTDVEKEPEAENGDAHVPGGSTQAGSGSTQA